MDMNLLQKLDSKSLFGINLSIKQAEVEVVHRIYHKFMPVKQKVI